MIVVKLIWVSRSTLMLVQEHKDAFRVAGVEAAAPSPGSGIDRVTDAQGWLEDLYDVVGTRDEKRILTACLSSVEERDAVMTIARLTRSQDRIVEYLDVVQRVQSSIV